MGATWLTDPFQEKEMASEKVFLLEIMYNSTMRSLEDTGLRDDSLPQIAQVKFAH